MLNEEFNYYLEHQDELLDKYNGKYLVIKNSEVVGSYDTIAEAYTEATKLYRVGTFLIQHCTPGKKAYTQTFHSRVSFHA